MTENTGTDDIRKIRLSYSSSPSFDRMILLDNGGIAESGMHNELLANGGTYAEMWNVQAEKYRAYIYA